MYRVCLRKLNQLLHEHCGGAVHSGCVELYIEAMAGHITVNSATARRLYEDFFMIKPPCGRHKS